jgi:branched-chain amino acid aminotransferase
MAEELTSYFNGRFVPDSQCMVHVTDRGFRYGDAVFDIQRTFNGRPFRVREHLERFMRSLKYARMDPGMSLDEWEELSLGLIERNEHLRIPGGDLNVGQYVSRGVGFDALDPVPLTVCVRVWHVLPSLWVKGFQEGVHGVIVKTKSYSPEAMESKVKHNNRLNFALAHLEAADVDPEGYPILTDTQGYVTENIQANLWIVTDGVLRTPTDRSALQGDARRFVFKLAGAMGIEAADEDLQPYDLYTADEVFFSNTAYCIMPVGRVDNRPIGEGAPGPITRQLQAAWSERCGIDIVDQALNYKAPEGVHGWGAPTQTR